MKNSLYLVLGTTVASVALVVFAVGCGKSGDHQEAQQQAAQTAQEAHMHEMSAEGLAYVYEAEALYTCPMHPQVVTDKADARCPQCGMKLTKMSDEDVAKLRASAPKGCPMCSIVVPGDSDATKCPRCGMDLVSIPAGESQSSQQH